MTARHPNLTGPKTPGGKARSRANLQRGAIRHGAYGGPKLAALQAKHGEELARDYPQLDARRRAVLAGRLARIEAASEWVSEHGITPGARHKRRGEVWGVVAALETWSRRAEDMLAAAEQEAREHEAHQGEQTLEEIVQEYRERDRLGAGDSDDEEPES